MASGKTELAELDPLSFVQKLKDLSAALRLTWDYAAFVLAMGIGAVFLSTLVPYPFWARVTEHVGMGLIVAAVAVVLAEWGAHYRPGLRMLSEVKAMKDMVGVVALEGALRATIRGGRRESEEAAVQHLKELALYLRRLHDDGDWAQEGYWEYLNWLLNYTTRHAKRLSDASAQLRLSADSGGEYRIQALSAAEITDTILAEQMEKLPPRGKYSIVSDIESWRSQKLKKLHEASKFAVARGVKIRRIFVLAREGEFATMGEEARKVLKAHLDIAQEWSVQGTGSYQIRVLPLHETEQMPGLVPQFAASLLKEHFGVFEQPEADHCIRIRVAAQDLSDLRIGGLARGSSDLDDFDRLWDVLTEVTSDSVDALVTEWDAAYH
ncbi:MAG TPA: hypothetical protein VFT45_12435 [Longimicrobium sp.]|nr:hypothetical protein [Longimicrobium sp.]